VRLRFYNGNEKTTGIRVDPLEGFISCIKEYRPVEVAFQEADTCIKKVKQVHRDVNPPRHVIDMDLVAQRGNLVAQGSNLFVLPSPIFV